MDYQQHLKFMLWADSQMLTAATPAAASEDAAVFTILDHVYRAEVVWLRRVSGAIAAQISEVETSGSLERLHKLWPEVHRQWLEWAQSVADSAAWETLTPHQDSRGTRYEKPRWQIVMHLVNHGSYHRGQATLLLRQGGTVPPATDLIAFYRNPA